MKERTLNDESSLPEQHPIGMTYQHRRGKNQTLLESPADWISPNFEGGLLSVEWLHPINGKSSTAETVTGGARRSFTAPVGEPVVLLLRNVSRS